jgi:hypothetical protein
VGYENDGHEELFQFDNKESAEVFYKIIEENESTSNVYFDEVKRVKESHRLVSKDKGLKVNYENNIHYNFAFKLNPDKVKTATSTLFYARKKDGNYIVSWYDDNDEFNNIDYTEDMVNTLIHDEKWIIQE